jgi:hypothetical protein
LVESTTFMGIKIYCARAQACLISNDILTPIGQ